MSEQVQTVNVEEIMQEIREKIAQSGYSEDILSFEDYKSSKVDFTVDRFELIRMEDSISQAEDCYQVQIYTEIWGNPVKRFIKKVIRKCVGLIMLPVAEKQERFNQLTLETMHQMAAYIEEQELEITQLKKRCERLENEKQ